MSKEQIFIEFKINFNLRQTKNNVPTLIYAVFYYDKKQYKCSTEVKVYPSQWNKKKQIATVSNGLTKLDNRNNKIVNKKILEVITRFEEKKEYICENIDSVNIIHELRKVINSKTRDMKQTNKKATLVLRQMMSKYIQEGSQGMYKSAINSFERYLKSNNIEDALYNINSDTLKAFVDSLTCQVKTIHNYEGSIITLIHKANEDSNIKANINLTGYKRIEDKRNKEQKKSKQIPLKEEQLKAIYELKDLNKKEEEARDIFLLQCLLGQRISDMPKLIKGEYIKTKIENTNDEVISFNVEKTKEEAVIYLFPIARNILEKYNNGLNYYNILSDDDNEIGYAENQLNNEIKRICKRAKLTNEITYVQQHGRNEISVKKKKLYELMHTHIARHTFITLMCRLGVPKENVIIATAHTDTKIIDDVYNHQTVEDKGRKLVNSYRNIKNSAFFNVGEEVKDNNNDKNNNAYGIVLTYDELKRDIIKGKELEDDNLKKNEEIKYLNNILAIEEQRNESLTNQFDDLTKKLEYGFNNQDIQAMYNEEKDINDYLDLNNADAERENLDEI